MSKYRKECWTDADVRCPFYISDERSARSITCEGCMDETRTRELKYSSRELRTERIPIFSRR